MENWPTWAGRNGDGGSLQCWLLLRSFSYGSLGNVCFFLIFVVVDCISVSIDFEGGRARSDESMANG